MLAAGRSKSLPHLMAGTIWPEHWTSFSEIRTRMNPSHERMPLRLIPLVGNSLDNHPLSTLPWHTVSYTIVQRTP